MERGFISIWRKFKNWQWYDSVTHVKVFIHLLLSVNHEDKMWRGKMIKRGEIITSYAHFAEDCSVSVKSLRTVLTHLAITNEVAINSTNKYTRITMLKYDLYQNPDTYWANKGQTKGKQRANKGQQLNNINNINKVNNNTYTSILNHFNSSCGKKLRLTTNNKKIIKARLKEYSEEDIKKAITNFSKDTWKGRENYCNLSYAIGIIGGKDNLEKWLSVESTEEKYDKLCDA